jgi:SET domain-containing protein
MFRIDNDTVVDATMAGGPARYINHSCNPNCVAEVVPFDKESKIIIITNRRIPTGEEVKSINIGLSVVYFNENADLWLNLERY